MAFDEGLAQVFSLCLPLSTNLLSMGMNREKQVALFISISYVKRFACEGCECSPHAPS